jgi:hypothetical protein
MDVGRARGRGVKEDSLGMMRLMLDADLNVSGRRVLAEKVA